MTPEHRAPGAWAVALTGAVALAVAMGIGRFAFTPLLPIMLADGVIDLRGAGWLASANYLGYLAGALLCIFLPWFAARAAWLPPVNGIWLLRAGLIATGLLTLGMGLPLAAAWPAMRFAAGVASALVFIYTSGWCLTQLAVRGVPALGGAMFAGPGVGIILSGLLASAMVAWQWHAASGWLMFGVLAFALTATVWRVFGHGSAPATAASRPAAAVDPESLRLHPPAEVAWLAFAYGLAGFGYIITATFLPVIARTALPGSSWLDLFWPIFGAGVMAGALLVTRLHVGGRLHRHLAIAYFVQAVGIVASLWSPTLAGFAIGSLLLGLPFTAITFFAMQEVRRMRPAAAASTMGLLTAMYGIGQIVGPPLAARLLHATGGAGPDFSLSLELAAGALLLGAAVYLWMERAFARR